MATDYQTRLRLTMVDILGLTAVDAEILLPDTVTRTLDEGYREFCLHTRYFKRTAIIAAVASQYWYALPLDFIDFEQNQVWYGTTRLYETTNDDLDDYDDAWRAQANDAPSNYVREGPRRIRIYPTPPVTVATDITITGSIVPSALTDAGCIAELSTLTLPTLPVIYELAPAYYAAWKLGTHYFTARQEVIQRALMAQERFRVLLNQALFENSMP